MRDGGFRQPCRSPNRECRRRGPPWMNPRGDRLDVSCLRLAFGVSLEGISFSIDVANAKRKLVKSSHSPPSGLDISSPRISNFFPQLTSHRRGLPCYDTGVI